VGSAAASIRFVHQRRLNRWADNRADAESEGQSPTGTVCTDTNLGEAFGRLALYSDSPAKTWHAHVVRI
jgi:hypothetical protein